MSKEESASCEKPGLDLDSVLVWEAGQFGRFQWRLLVLMVLVSIAAGCSNTEYLFTAARINTRCLIPECELDDVTNFSPSWLPHAVPSTGASFDGCRRYAPNVTNDVTNGTCYASLFDPTVTVPCEQYVFEDTDTIVFDLELACDEWRRSLIGSVRTLGMLVSLPITGFVSDHWGRRTALVVTAVNTSWLGIIRYWANSYTSFVISQFIDSALGSGRFSCAFILLLELVGPRYRVHAGAALNIGIAIGHMTTALLAYLVPYWRNLTLTIYVPQLLFLTYFWIVPESIRWYHSKGKLDKAEEAITKIARVNGKNLSEKTLLQLSKTGEVKENQRENKKEDEPWLIFQVFHHRPILVRCIILSVVWASTTFVYYGLSINAVNMVGNRYLYYAVVSAMEIPGVWFSVMLMNSLGRRPLVACGFWVCVLCQLSYIFISTDMVGATILLYSVGMCSITMVLSTIYVYTGELFPTRHRHTLFAFSSMMGRIGAMLAPLTPALSVAVFEWVAFSLFGGVALLAGLLVLLVAGVAVSEWVPFSLFGGVALLAGLLVLLVPETRGAPMPDTMQQAASLGRDHTKE